MYNKLQSAYRYLKYYFTASNGKGHGIHSPFVFDLITRVLNDKASYPEYDVVEKLRDSLVKDETILTIEDMGAGSTVSKSDQRSVASIAANAAKPKKIGQLLFRMVRYFQPQTIIELGTSLGITSSYLALARPGCRFITMEGAKEVAAKARVNFHSLGIQNSTLLEGNFDDTLPKVITDVPGVDFAFIDGNHRQEPTERYFSQLLSKSHNETVLVFDDIHWSREMEAAWETIKADSRVRCTVDLFFIGLVFFRQEFHEKQHFTIWF